VGKIRRKYDSKFNTLQNRLLRAEQAIAREQEQAKSQKMKTVISFGTALLGSLLGRKKVSASSARSFGTAMKSASRMQKESMDVKRAGALAEKMISVNENKNLVNKVPSESQVTKWVDQAKELPRVVKY